MQKQQKAYAQFQQQMRQKRDTFNNKAIANSQAEAPTENKTEKAQ
jgi:hypothetical protein